MEFFAINFLMFYITICQIVDTSEPGSNTFKHSDVIKDLLKNYEKNDPPRINESTQVSIAINVFAFEFTNQPVMEFTATFYIRQQWNDPRLSFRNKYPTLGRLSLWEKDIDSFWKPDLFVANEKSSTGHQLFMEHRFMRVGPDGDVMYGVDVSVVAFCSMFLRKFPFDVQNCSLQFESYAGTDSNTVESIRLVGEPNPINASGWSPLPSFVLTGKSVEDCSRNFTTRAYPCLEFIMTLTREPGFYLLNIYFPSILVVILSWLSFWLNSNGSVSRMLLGLMSILFMAIITLGVDTQQASVSYATALDVWTNVCFLFTFAVLFQFAAVYFLAHRSTSDSTHRLVNEDIDMGERRIRSSASEDQQPVLSMETQTKTWSEKLDFYSRIAFPAVFLFFNIVYWSVYAS